MISAALNQSTRPKKKSKEKRKEREEKDKQRQEQRKQMKDAIIREIRKTDEKTDKTMADDGTKKKKRNRINKERVDINATGNMERLRFHVQIKMLQVSRTQNKAVANMLRIASENRWLRLK